MIPLFKVFMAPAICERVNKVLMSGMIAQGPVVAEYEQALQRYFNNPRLLTLNSATSGLTLAYRLLNLPPGTTVLSTPLTCTATNWPILANNLRIKWVDVDTNTCNMDLDDLERKLDKTTRVVSFVHWGGSPLDLARLEEIKDKYEARYNQELYVIEDCAHAFGALFKGAKIGSPSRNICVFSTQAIKHLTTIDGGFITLPTDELYERAKKLRWFGIDRLARTTEGGDFRLEPDVKEWGYKFNMNDVNASVGLGNLPYIDKNIEHARELARFYDTELGAVEGACPLKQARDAESSYWIYTIRIVDKYEFIAFMKENGVMCSQVHNRNDQHSCVAEYRAELPQLNQLEQEIVCIPCGWWVSMGDARRIVDLVKQWCSSRSTTNEPVVISQLSPKDDFKEYFSVLAQLNGQNAADFTRVTFQQRLYYQTLMGQSIFVAKINKKIVGTAKLVIEPKFFDPIGHIEDVVVAQEYRGKGVGRALIQRALEKAKEEKCYKVVLEHNGRVAPFYEALGFKRCTEAVVYRAEHSV